MKRKRSLTLKLLLGVLLTILPVNCFMLFQAHTAQQVTGETVKASLSNTARVYISQMETHMENINSFIWLLEESDGDLKRLSELTDWDYYYIAAMGLRQTLNRHMLSYGDADAYFFYSDHVESGMVVENSDALSVTAFQEAVLSDKALLADNRWRLQTIGETQWLLHTNQWKGVYIGAGIQLDSVAEEARENLSYQSARVWFDASRDMETDRGVYAVSEKCGRRDVWMHIDVDSGEVSRSLPLLRRISYVLALILLLLIPAIILIIHRLVLGPLNTVNAAIRGLQTDPDTRITAEANTSDFDNVNRSFNKMADKIVELRIDNYEREIQRQKVELRNLQLQVKPHFLFNSLNLMYNLVQMGEYQSVQQMLLYFSDYFRYINVGDNDFSLFGEELELIRKYVGVAQIRYPGIVAAEYDVSDEALEAKLPQLLVHNFVENIVKHGLDLSRQNHIQLRAWLEKGDLVVEVEDDGIGMSSQQAENVNHGIFEYQDGKRHLGLKNSSRRIRFYYGRRGSMHIESAEGQGTKVTLRFPADPETEDNHEPADRQR